MKVTVLLAEDDPVTRWDLREVLQSHGYNVVEASSGEEAVERARAQRPDLLLLDIKMPNCDGLEALERLAGLDLPAVLLTAYSQKEQVEKAQDLGVLGYLVKPAPEAEVLATVELALANAHRVANLRSQVGQLFTQLSDRKEVERAKDVLCSRLGVTPEQAYVWLRTESMRKRRPIREIAVRVLEVGERSGNVKVWGRE